MDRIGIESANTRVATQLLEQAYEALVREEVREAWRQEKMPINCI